MVFDYSKLWVMLKKRGMTREDLRMQTKMSSTTMARMGKNKTVSLSVLGRICETLSCDVGDIIRYSKNDNPNF
ncbi:XRE family transcriptional regulator [Aerococcus urinaehominis]|uniref:XRE family transcriptional regulator n=1 Tax=Aerococcus urinaehominis TaxID=128944 RepID=A0A0X8FNC9_9LACT|nr:helix-turn-helix transcriptional regulator [Aerococcus urinaehominis]AMB99832.1 XRE family transcriptional regulator [Aerococcus urinaehominis]SDM55625.1 DNA-binding transcriptional regulator, XRE family [Aerococcus urinaehominis]